MKKEEFDFLKTTKLENKILTVEDLHNKKERTLLYGYTCEKHTWHVYLKDNEIITVVYPYKEKPEKIEITHNKQYVPNKRLYPESCDYEFCTLLKSCQIDLPFTIWNDELSTRIIEKYENVKYFGEILDS